MTVETTTDYETTGYRLSAQIGFKLRLANQKHLEVFARLMPGLTPTQFAILARLSEAGPQSQNQLGREVGMDAATTKGVVDRLRGRGLVSATPRPSDLRRLDIALTDAGAAQVSEAIATAEEISRITTQNLNERERKRLLELLDKL